MSMPSRFEHTLGADLGGSKLLLCYRDQRLTLPTGPGFDAAALEVALRRFVQAQDLPPRRLGLAIPGLLDEHQTVSACDVLPGLVGWHAASALADLLPACWLVNDAKAALHASTADLPPGSTAVTVMVGTAVGCGLLADGQLLRGAQGWAGELGYWPVRQVQGQGQGWRRLDELAGGGYIAAALGTDGPGLRARANAGEPQALALIQQGGEALGAALAGLVNLLNPRRLALGGGTLRLPGYLPALRQSLQALALPALLQDCELLELTHVDDLVAQGAALLAEQQAQQQAASRPHG